MWGCSCSAACTRAPPSGQGPSFLCSLQSQGFLSGHASGFLFIARCFSKSFSFQLLSPSSRGCEAETKLKPQCADLLGMNSCSTRFTPLVRKSPQPFRAGHWSPRELGGSSATNAVSNEVVSWTEKE